MTGHQTIAVLDFGSQYTQLIARRIREHNVFSLILSPDVSVETLAGLNVVGVVLSGGPASAYEAEAPTCDGGLFDLGVPVLGICYGMQLGCRLLGAEVASTRAREYGRTPLRIVRKESVVADLPEQTDVWMSHGDVVAELPEAFLTLAETETCRAAAVVHRGGRFVGLQFHPEVTHTPEGGRIFRSFLFDLCGCRGDWRLGDVVEEMIEGIGRRIGGSERVLCALSGGVDSAVTAVLLQRAVPDRLVCVFVDNGLLRQGEAALVEKTFRDHFRIDLRVVDARSRFLSALAGVCDPYKKRRIIGHRFVDVFRDEARTIPNARYLAQGTLYPDVIESGHGHAGTAAAIKPHHNVGGLPEALGFDLVEPLRELFKDEVRLIGEQLGLPHELAWRHPFPGPGLAVRIVGAVTEDRLALIRRADKIVVDEIVAAGWYGKIAQAFPVLLPVASVGVMGDKQSYAGQYVVALRFVETTDFMTADWVRVDSGLLGRISSRIMNEIEGINRVVYDVSTKPPATIEWE